MCPYCRKWQMLCGYMPCQAVTTLLAWPVLSNYLCHILQELANTMWAYATLGFTPSLDWLVQMGAACEEQVGGCKPQDLANLVWALATLQFHPGAPFLTAAMDTANRYLPCYCISLLCVSHSQTGERLDVQLLGVQWRANSPSCIKANRMVSHHCLIAIKHDA